MNSISFGRIIKINGTKEIALKVADIANNNGKKQIDRQIRSVFYDLPYGKAIAVSSEDDNNSSYVFSGEDAQLYYRSEKIAKNAIERAYSDFGNAGGMGKLKAEIAVNSHKCRINDLLSKTFIKPSMNVELNKTGEICGIDLVS